MSKVSSDLSDCPVMHSRLTDLPPKTPDSQTSSDGSVERWVSVEQQIERRLGTGEWKCKQ